MVCVYWRVLHSVNDRVPENYMDEPFHVPQTQHYCAGRFDVWDPKITTFPGLYLAGTLFCWLRLASSRLSGSFVHEAVLDVCPTSTLRTLNVLLSVACFYTLLATLRDARQQQRAASPAQSGPAAGGAVSHPRSAAAAVAAAAAAAPAPGRWWRGTSLPLCALVLSLFPLHWFYAFLYYTDTAALLSLLWCHRLAVQGRSTRSGLAGAVAVLCRQTNAVWVAFVLGASILRCAEEERLRVAAAAAGATASPLLKTATASAASDPAAPPHSTTSRVAAQHLAVGSSPTPGRQPPHTQRKDDATAAATAVQERRGDDVLSVLSIIWRLRASLLRKYWALAVVPLAFVAFAAANGGIVVGDRAAHAPVRHWAQPLYFCLFSAALLAPVLLLPGARGNGSGGGGGGPPALETCRAVVAALRVAPLRAATLGAAALAATAAALLASRATPHPYLVADNRHLTFYVWRRILAAGGTAGAVALAAAATAAAGTLARLLLRRQSPLWVLGFTACLAVTLVPAWLLEFRYFTPGFMLLALHLPLPSNAQLALLGLMYAAVDTGTMYLFLHRPFGHWSDGSVARFIW